MGVPTWIRRRLHLILVTLIAVVIVEALSFAARLVLSPIAAAIAAFVIGLITGIALGPWLYWHWVRD